MQEIELKSENLDSRCREAFMILRTNIEFYGKGAKVICMTGCTPRDGKSYTAYHLAKNFAEGGKRVLLIDGDLKKSSLKKRHKSGKVRHGLSNYLVGRSTLDDAMCRTDIKHLYVIFSGPTPPNSAELLGNRRFSAMLREVKEKFDYVIIDTPSYAKSIDAAVVAKQCDGMVMVMKNNGVSRRFAQQIKEQMELTGCKILGVVLNRVPRNKCMNYYGKRFERYFGSAEE